MTKTPPAPAAVNGHRSDSAPLSTGFVHWVPAPLLVVREADGVVLDANAALAGFDGARREPLAGRTIGDLVPKLGGSGWNALVQLLPVSLTPLSLEWHWRMPSGRLQPVRCSLNPAQISGIACIVMHITPGIEDGGAAAGFDPVCHGLFEQAAVGMSYSDADGMFLRVNRRFTEIFGYEPAEVIGRGLELINIPSDLATERALMRSAREGRRDCYTLEKQCRRKNGQIVWVSLAATLVRDPTGAPRHYIRVIEDISRRKHAEDALRTSEARLRHLMNASRAVIYSLRRIDGRLHPAWVSEGISEFGYSPPEALRSGWWQENLHPDDRARMLATNRRPFFEGGGRVSEYRFRQRDGRYRWIRDEMAVVRDQRGDFLEVVGAWTDIHNRKQVEDDLVRSERRLQQAQAMARVGNWELDLRQNHLWWSEEIFRIFELDPKGFPASYEAFLNVVHPEDRGRVDRAYQESVEKRTPYQITHRVLTADRRIKYVQETCETEYDATGHAVRSYGTVQDITATAKAEESLRQSLHEKETLLREVHHRVKNNLQIISGLLHFQAKRVRDPQDRAAFTDGRNRLRSMILVHEKLYRSGQFSQIDFADYVQSLVHALQVSYAAEISHVTVSIDAEPCQFEIEQALPCGMILCELVTNAFKHAFPERQAGHVVIRTYRHEGRFHLEVSDDGVGVPAAVNFAHSDMFGWQLIQNLVAQLDGNFVGAPRAVGTKVAMTFPLQPQPLTTP